MTERGGYYRFKTDGSEEKVEFDLPNGSVKNMLEAISSLPRPEPCIIVSRAVFEWLKSSQ